MAGDGNARDVQFFGEYRIHGDKAFNCPLLEEQRIFLDEFVAVAVADHEIKVAFLEQVVFDSGHNEGGVSLADFRNNDADGEAALLPEGSRKMIGPVIQFAGSRANQFLRALRNGLSGRGAIDNEGNGGLRKAEVFGKVLEANPCAGGFPDTGFGR